MNYLELETGSTTSSQAHLIDSLAATAAANRTEDQAGEVLCVLETRKKLKKLQDVRERLNQLRDLVQYYQSGTEFIHGESQEDASSLPALSDFEENMQPSPSR